MAVRWLEELQGLLLYCFFFQAEDGIRDLTVTGVQTCALPISAPTPSWGELIGQGMENLTKWWLVFYPLGVLFTTLLLVVFIGEAVREAFDPKEHSRLR